MSEILTLVDEKDNVIGTKEKIATHIEGLLHRAFSVIVLNSFGKVLIQKRASVKYHSAGLWANSCCGHPRPKEDIMEAAKRRLYEELGFSCDLLKITKISYSLKLDNGLYENEYTHIFVGIYNGEIIPNPEEVSEIKWLLPNVLLKEVKHYPEKYSLWFNLYMSKYYNDIFNNKVLSTIK